uniref:Uncharacterized protein n=1 Tax=Parastrongyloides trichosuri TaxID=131310 RepID=A0A0N4Z496_PARTI
MVKRKVHRKRTSSLPPSLVKPLVIRNELSQETPKTIKRSSKSSPSKELKSQSRLRLPIVKKKTLFGGTKNGYRKVAIPLEFSGNSITQHAHIVTNNTYHSDNKDEDLTVNDLLCHEVFFDEYLPKTRKEGLDDLNNRMFYIILFFSLFIVLYALEDFSTTDLKEQNENKRQTYTPPSRAGERSRGMKNHYEETKMDES